MKLLRAIQPLVGLDIGSTAVKLVVLKEAVGGVNLQDFRVEELPLTTEKRENIPLEVILESLKKTIVGIGIKRTKITTVVSGPRVSVRRVTVPHMPKEELLEAIKWEAKDHIPFSIENAAVDYYIVGETTEKTAKKLELLVVAVEKFIIEQHLALLQNIGIRPASITVTPFALREVIKKSHEFGSADIFGVVNSGAEITAINVFRGDALVFNREVPIGGNTITRAMVGTLISDAGQVELDINQAEIIKKEWGIPDEKNPQQLTKDISSIQLLPLMRPILERLTNEIRRSLDYYREESRGEKAQRLLIFGGNAELKGLRDFIANALGLEVQIGTPLKNIQVAVAKEKREDLDFLAPRLAVSIGAALTAAKGINLLPQELKEQATKTARSALTGIITFLIVFIFIVVYFTFYSQFLTYQKVVAGLETSLADLKTQVAQAYQLQELRQKMLARINLINRLTVGEVDWLDILKEISNITPTSITLTEILLEKQKEEAPATQGMPSEGGTEEGVQTPPVKQNKREIRLKGIVNLILVERPETILAKFMEALEASPYFSETDLIQLQKTEEEKKNFVNFEITCQLESIGTGQ